MIRVLLQCKIILIVSFVPDPIVSAPYLYVIYAVSEVSAYRVIHLNEAKYNKGKVK